MSELREKSVGPLYAKVKHALLTSILEGKRQRGDRVPSENELVREFGVSRMTANRALRELTEEGYLVRIAGVGTFVADFKTKSPLLEIRNIADEVRERGHAYSSEVILNRKESASTNVARRLDIAEAAPVFHTLVLHKEENIPLQVEERFVRPDVVPDYGSADFSKTTPSAFLLKATPLHDAEHTVRANIPSEQIRNLLHMDKREPCLLVERRTWSNGHPATLAFLFHPGNRFELSGRLRP